MLGAGLHPSLAHPETVLTDILMLPASGGSDREANVCGRNHTLTEDAFFILGIEEAEN